MAESIRDVSRINVQFRDGFSHALLPPETSTVEEKGYQQITDKSKSTFKLKRFFLSKPAEIDRKPARNLRSTLSCFSVSKFYRFMTTQCCPCIPWLLRSDKGYLAHIAKNWPELYQRFALEELPTASFNPEEHRVKTFRDFMFGADLAARKQKLQLGVIDAFGSQIMAHEIHPEIFTSPEVVRHLESFSRLNQYELKMSGKLLAQPRAEALRISSTDDVRMLSSAILFSSKSRKLVFKEAKRAFIVAGKHKVVPVKQLEKIFEAIDLSKLRSGSDKAIRLTLVKLPLEKPRYIKETGLTALGFFTVLMEKFDRTVSIEHTPDYAVVVTSTIYQNFCELLQISEQINGILGVNSKRLLSGQEPYEQEWDKGK
ncbi:hypothetical protein D5018_15810 [Parashewanella curva]|uniref:Uncharacterized protein n=1 Tax=Parashewanella curva TaxID=2338552 RepID=A0A3L8PTV5_9GAMM|nr:hypothetical protein [Parashewanella curva]RLV58724.1 hypothetical protein D5018_15810 [Parashewanella curva]